MNNINATTSRFQIGDKVKIGFRGGENDGVEIHGYVRTIIFTGSKVRYSVLVLSGCPPNAITPAMLEKYFEATESQPQLLGFTLHNVDSALLTRGYGERLDLGPDNYS
jgi:hypothetical protein